jgi:hypothetical protein
MQKWRSIAIADYSVDDVQVSVEYRIDGVAYVLLKAMKWWMFVKSKTIGRYDREVGRYLSTS